MSTHQQSKPRAANQSIAEESGRPGTCRSKVGCEAIEEPCTNRMVPAGPVGSPAYFSHMNSRTSLPLLVQCSSPRIAAPGATGLFILLLLFLRGGREDGALRAVDRDRHLIADFQSLQRVRLNTQALPRGKRHIVL